jgi:hypothetical protein
MNLMEIRGEFLNGVAQALDGHVTMFFFNKLKQLRFAIIKGSIVWVCFSYSLEYYKFSKYIFSLKRCDIFSNAPPRFQPTAKNWGASTEIIQCASCPLSRNRNDSRSKNRSVLEPGWDPERKTKKS